MKNVFVLKLMFAARWTSWVTHTQSTARFALITFGANFLALASNTLANLQLFFARVRVNSVAVSNKLLFHALKMFHACVVLVSFLVTQSSVSARLLVTSRLLLSKLFQVLQDHNKPIYLIFNRFYPIFSHLR